MSLNEKGIYKIKVPYRKEDFETSASCIEIFRKHLAKVLELQNSNSIKQTDLKNYYLGIQDIRTKKRMFSSDNSFNNQTVENHALAQVDFLTDYLLSEKVKFSSKSMEDVDDISVFENFLTDAGFYTTYRETKKDMFMLGVGVSYANPRTDIIETNENGMTSYSKDYKKDVQSPFIYTYLDPRNNFVVYSSYAGEAPLFCVSITDKSVGNELPMYDIEIWTYKWYFKYEATSSSENPYVIDFEVPPYKVQPLAFTKGLPIVETYCNKERIGIIEVNRDVYNLINLIDSLGADAMYDVLNKVFVFENVEISGDDFDNMIANKSIKVTSSGNPNEKPNVYTIEVSYPHSDINVFYKELVQQSYDIVGVPRASGNSSNGTTGDGQRYGGGWENAEIKMNGRIIGMQQSDYQLLKLLFDICKLVPQTKINELEPSQIEITYQLSVNDNIQSKTQSASALYSMHFPLEAILKKCRLSNDPINDAKKWQTYIDEIEKKNEEKEMRKAEQSAKQFENQKEMVEQKTKDQEKAKVEKGINQKGVKDIKEN